MVFIYLKESSNAFSLLTCEEGKTLSKTFGNVFIIVTKLGKLQKETCEWFFYSVIKPYVKKN
jgi:hypothetical protein